MERWWKKLICSQGREKQHGVLITIAFGGIPGIRIQTVCLPFQNCSGRQDSMYTIEKSYGKPGHCRLGFFIYRWWLISPRPTDQI
jgi:hypothetical protein